MLNINKTFLSVCCYVLTKLTARHQRLCSGACQWAAWGHCWSSAGAGQAGLPLGLPLHPLGSPPWGTAPCIPLGPLRPLAGLPFLPLDPPPWEIAPCNPLGPLHLRTPLGVEAEEGAKQTFMGIFQYSCLSTVMVLLVFFN